MPNPDPKNIRPQEAISQIKRPTQPTKPNNGTHIKQSPETLKPAWATLKLWRPTEKEDLDPFKCSKLLPGGLGACSCPSLDPRMPLPEEGCLQRIDLRLPPKGF